MPEQLRRSLVWDQGAERAQHAQLRIDTGLQVYFCDPQSPWQRGSNENTNGLVYRREGTSDFETGGLRRINGVSQTAERLIRALEPYKGGNDAPRRLHRLDANDKHRLLLVVGAAYRSLTVEIRMEVPWREEPVVFPPLTLQPKDRIFPLKDGAEVYRVMKAARTTPYADDDPKVALEIAISDGEVVHGEPVIPTLGQLVQFVDELVGKFGTLLRRRELPPDPPSHSVSPSKG